MIQLTCRVILQQGHNFEKMINILTINFKYVLGIFLVIPFLSCLTGVIFISLIDY